MRISQSAQAADKTHNNIYYVNSILPLSVRRLVFAA